MDIRNVATRTISNDVEPWPPDFVRDLRILFDFARARRRHAAASKISECRLHLKRKHFTSPLEAWNQRKLMADAATLSIKDTNRQQLFHEEGLLEYLFITLSTIESPSIKTNSTSYHASTIQVWSNETSTFNDSTIQVVWILLVASISARIQLSQIICDICVEIGDSLER